MIVLLASLFVSPAQASAYYFTDIGVRGFSRAGANVVGANDMTALWYNPAALSNLERGQVMLDVAGVGHKVVFDRADEDGQPPFDPVENQAPLYAIPHFGVAHRLGTPDTVFAFGFYPPYAPDYSYDSAGAQRYTLNDTLVIQTSLGPTVAHEFADWFTVGVGVAWNILIAQQELATNLDSPLDDEDQYDPAYDVDFSLEATDRKGFSWNVGFKIEPPSGRWAVGGMFQPPVAFDAKGSMSADFNGNVFYETDDPFYGGLIEDPIAVDEDVSLAVTMPMIAKAGALVRPTDALEIEAAVVWQQWSSIDSMTVTDVDLGIGINEDHFAASLIEAAGGCELDENGERVNCDAVIDEDVVLPANYDDAISVRLGGHYILNDRLTVRAGVLYETSAIPTQTVGVSLVDAKKWGYGLGGSLGLGKNTELDIGISQSFFQDLDISDSEVTQIRVNPLAGEGEDTLIDGIVVGNGTIESSLFMVGVGIVKHFGPERGS
jgi:long-chain fatty acid transport protein